MVVTQSWASWYDIPHFFLFFLSPRSYSQGHYHTPFPLSSPFFPFLLFLLFLFSLFLSLLCLFSLFPSSHHLPLLAVTVTTTSCVMSAPFLVPPHLPLSLSFFFFINLFFIFIFNLFSLSQHTTTPNLPSNVSKKKYKFILLYFTLFFYFNCNCCLWDLDWLINMKFGLWWVNMEFGLICWMDL